MKFLNIFLFKFGIMIYTNKVNIFNEFPVKFGKCQDIPNYTDICWQKLLHKR